MGNLATTPEVEKESQEVALPGVEDETVRSVAEKPESITVSPGGQIDASQVQNIVPNGVAMEIARLAEENTRGIRSSSGWCLREVNDVTDAVAGVRRTAWAIQATDAYRESGKYVEVTGFDPNGKSREQIEEFLNSLPPGAVAIYDKNGLGTSVPGHAQIKGLSGEWHSDFTHRATVYSGPMTMLNVFIPVSGDGTVEVADSPLGINYEAVKPTQEESLAAAEQYNTFLDIEVGYPANEGSIETDSDSDDTYVHPTQSYSIREGIEHTRSRGNSDKNQHAEVTQEILLGLHKTKHGESKDGATEVTTESE